MDHFRTGRRPYTFPATVVVAQLLAVAAGLLGVWAGLPWWAALTVAAVLGAGLFVRVGGRWPLTWAVSAWRHLCGRRAGIGVGDDFTAAGETVGLHRVGGQVLAVLEVLPPGPGPSRLTRDACITVPYLPLSSLADCLEQNDVTLAGIDVVSHGSRTAEGTAVADVYDALIGPLPASGRRSVWVTLRFDVAASAAAAARRGGGADGLSRTVAVAARRVIRTLADAGCPARILSASEIESVCARICRGVHPDAMARRWDHVPLTGARHVGAVVDPRRLSAQFLARAVAVPSLGTTLAVRIRPGRSGAVRVGASVGWTVRDGVARPRLPGLIVVHGRHRDALSALLPVSAPELDGLVPLRDVDRGRLDALQLPATGCGQLVGADVHGDAVAARLTGPGVTDVYVAGELHVAQQVVFRAVATGARVLVRTDRPHTWATLVGAVANPILLRLSDDVPGTDGAGSAVDTVVVDGVPAPPARPGVTLVHVHPDPRLCPPARPDVAIVQPGGCGDRVVLTVGAVHLELAVVTIPSEVAFVGRPTTALPAPV
ncbi:type VII secretion protein EccE [Prescottella subtropica]|uniref:type VII secretion protein EccE n=1 Tax=Prescottella subtropica TaxID=2545757 RepID=UPI0010F4C2BE|nr:type VII secretion protein EccE [Prescottella subtropica]